MKDLIIFFSFLFFLSCSNNAPVPSEVSLSPEQKSESDKFIKERDERYRENGERCLREIKKLTKKEDLDNFELCALNFREDMKNYRARNTIYSSEEAPRIVGCFGGCSEEHYRDGSHYHFQLTRCLVAYQFNIMCLHLEVPGSKHIYNNLGELLYY